MFNRIRWKFELGSGKRVVVVKRFRVRTKKEMTNVTLLCSLGELPLESVSSSSRPSNNHIPASVNIKPSVLYRKCAS